MSCLLIRDGLCFLWGMNCICSIVVFMWNLSFRGKTSKMLARDRGLMANLPYSGMQFSCTVWCLIKMYGEFTDQKLKINFAHRWTRQCWLYEAVSHGTTDKDSQKSTFLTHQTSDRTKFFLFLSLSTHGWCATKIEPTFLKYVAKFPSFIFKETSYVRKTKCFVTGDFVYKY